MRLDPPTPVPQRVSSVDREVALRKLKAGCAQERLSLDTFSSRVEGAFAARTRGQLDELLRDLHGQSALSRATEGLVGRFSRWTAGLQAAWRTPRTPRLALPARTAVTLGRSPRCDCVLSDPTVSRVHAHLRYRDGVWLLRDLQSTNGTRLNGWRVVDEVEVRAGDSVSFGGSRYRLAPPL